MCLKFVTMKITSPCQVEFHCCTNDGCNWNLTTASSDISWSDYAGGASLPTSTGVQFNRHLAPNPYRVAQVNVENLHLS